MYFMSWNLTSRKNSTVPKRSFLTRRTFSNIFNSTSEWWYAITTIWRIRISPVFVCLSISKVLFSVNCCVSSRYLVWFLIGVLTPLKSRDYDKKAFEIWRKATPSRKSQCEGWTKKRVRENRPTKSRVAVYPPVFHVFQPLWGLSFAPARKPPPPSAVREDRPIGKGGIRACAVRQSWMPLR